MTHAEMFVRFTDGTGRVLHSVRNSADNRRLLDHMAWRLMSKPNVESVAVNLVEGRVAGFDRSRGSYR